MRVRLGDYNLKSVNDGASHEDYPVSEIINHPDYRPPPKYNDIALLKLGRRVSIRKNIRPACLHTGSGLPESKVIAIGWGRTQRGRHRSDRDSDRDLSEIIRDDDALRCRRKPERYAPQGRPERGWTERLQPGVPKLDETERPAAGHNRFSDLRRRAARWKGYLPGRNRVVTAFRKERL